MTAEAGYVWVILKRQGIADFWANYAFWDAAESREAALEKMQQVIGGPWSSYSRVDGGLDVHMGRMDWLLKRVKL